MVRYCSLGVALLCVLCCGGMLFAADTCDTPIIFVHGYEGWGPEEMEGLFYWGGSQDLRVLLRAAGYRVEVATVGALSSNWDRAMELYYQIRGGQVDYGAAHSEAYGHLQRPSGKVYTDPLYPEWDADHPVHLVGHSMGGQTIRMLAAIMQGAEPHYRDVLLDPQGRPCTPGGGWIRSITTLSAPHCGASLFDVRDNSLSVSLGILAVAGLEAIDFIPDAVYNFDLEQWELEPGAQESLFTYLERVDETIGSSPDYSVWELSVTGAERFNALVNLSDMDPQMYCFSYATCQSVSLGNTPYTLPAIGMYPFFINDAI